MSDGPEHPCCDIGDGGRVLAEEGEKVERGAADADDADIPKEFQFFAEGTEKVIEDGQAADTGSKMKRALRKPSWRELIEKRDVAYIEQQVVCFDVPKRLERPQESRKHHPAEDADREPLNDFFEGTVHGAMMGWCVGWHGGDRR